MTEERYARWTAPLRAHPQATRVLLAANKLLTIVGYVAYPLLLALLALEALGVWNGSAGIGGGSGAEVLGGAGILGSAGDSGQNGGAGIPGNGGAEALGGDSASARALLARCIIVPAISFIAVSVFRRIYNAPRPYEALDIQPLIVKNTQGKSFPSRHTFSMFMIAVSWLAWQPVVGGILLVAGAIMGIIRVLGGVHFPRDVVAGALAAIAAGLVGYVLIP